GYPRSMLMQGTDRQIRWAEEILARHLRLAESHLPQITAKLERAISAAEGNRWGAAYERARLAVACNYANRLQQWRSTDIIDAQVLLTSPYAIYDAIWTIISKIARADLGFTPVQPEQEGRPTLH
ncbi:MAG: hypothetical protein L0H73_16565, partial [Nitrococcus sp.]|nr:hypothetical protein [Nitrococcus sp.]